jgi:hypothetical protein
MMRTENRNVMYIFIVTIYLVCQLMFECKYVQDMNSFCNITFWQDIFHLWYNNQNRYVIFCKIIVYKIKYVGIRYIFDSICWNQVTIYYNHHRSAASHKAFFLFASLDGENFRGFILFFS